MNIKFGALDPHAEYEQSGLIDYGSGTPGVTAYEAEQARLDKQSAAGNFATIYGSFADSIATMFSIGRGDRASTSTPGAPGAPGTPGGGGGGAMPGWLIPAGMAAAAFMLFRK